MIHTIEFGKLSAILLDFVDSSDGFLYLRMVGVEPVVNAIWAKLSARNNRGQKWNSPVGIPIVGRSYPDYVAAQKQVRYRTLRTRLTSDMVDMAMIHPCLTVAEDNKQGFFLLTYEDGMPTSFFERLNHCLSLPLKPEWAAWLWQSGQQPQSFFTLKQETARHDGQTVEKTSVVESTQTPITQLSGLGRVTCYSIRCEGEYKSAWLDIIRNQLDLGIRLTKEPHVGGEHRYVNGSWLACPFVLPDHQGWRLHQNDEMVLEASSLNHLLIEARQNLGLHFIVEEESRGSLGS